MWVLLTQVIGVCEERNAEVLSDVGVVGARLGEDRVTLLDESPGQELAVVAEPNDPNLESIGLLVLGFDLELVVKGLCSIDGLDS